MRTYLKLTAGMPIAVLAPTLGNAQSAPAQPAESAPQAAYPSKAQTPEQQAAGAASFCKARGLPRGSRIHGEVAA
jgi:hypothetical protein